MNFGQHAGRRLELLQRIFGVQADLDRRAARRALQALPIKWLIRSHAQHALDQVQASDGFGDRMLDLQAACSPRENRTRRARGRR